ncbi:hypothetical protein O0I10_002662 [Lichtheimia ornata]|uniref:Uncharacterized protein n=1 Tax=Lichtheimia ornata TaxID=688661 RepID=A0AAD7VAF2_9FUNG|nr:uncharacterized protein O0I10_002662 [Lichtheimia ornata]KAJ8661396.1 hypothetical protein O0I10_002662 [Lichtheimia ornata]
MATTTTTTTSTSTTTTLTYEKPHDVALTSHSVMALSLEETDYHNYSKSVDRAAHVDAMMTHTEEEEEQQQQQHRLNRLELEHAYLAEQNTHLTKELSFARCTISALRNITTQKEESLQATRQELDRAYFRIKMLGMTLMRQEQQLQQQQQAWMEMMQHQQQQQQQQSYDDEEAGHLSHRSLTTAAAHQHIEALLQRRAGKEQQQQQQQQRRHLDHQQQLTPPESPRRIDEQGQGLDDEY